MVILKSFRPFIMKKLLASLFILSFCLFSCTEKTLTDQIVSKRENSHYLSIEKAKQEVEDILSARALTRSGYFEPTRKIASVWTAKNPTTRSGLDPDQQEVYIMNFADSAGFAIVSSDNRIGLLGLALRGSLNEGDVIEDPGFGMTLLNMDGLLRSEPLDTTEVEDEQEYWDAYGEWENTFYEPTYGYSQVDWHQDYPYREFCYTAAGDSAAVGCVPVAVAQLMSIYKYPTSYQQYWFNWDAMIANPLYVDPIGEHTVARLMYLLGTSDNLDVTYGVDDSGADFLNIPRTLENFGYTSGGTVAAYSTYSVKNELIAGYPVLINGFSFKTTTITTELFGLITHINYSYSGGHAWLGHGLLVRSRPIYHYCGEELLSTDYENEYFIRCNFGENDTGKDGYYQSGIFNYNFGWVYADDYHTRSHITQTTEGTLYNYQFKMRTVTGIRR